MRGTSGSILVSLAAIASLALPGCSNESPRGNLPTSSSLRQEQSVDTLASPAEESVASDEYLAAASTSATACYWPRFHGPEGRNHSADTGLLKKWPADGPPLAWKASGIGMGYSGVTITNGRIYTDGNIKDKTVVTAMGMNGRIEWQAENGPAWTQSYEGTRGTPTIDDDRVYHESPLGEVICLDAKSGKKIWSVNILDKFGGKNIQWALAESVLIDGDRVICCPGGPQVSIVALNKRSGEAVWKARSTGDLASYGSPVLVEYQGLRMIMTMNAKAIIGVNADNGDLLWRHEHETQYDVNAMMPLYHDGHVFISTGYGSGSELLKIHVDAKKASVEQVWASKELDNQHGGVVLVEGYLYGAAHSANRGQWICLEWKTGKKMYSDRGVGRGTLTYADGMLVTMSERRDVGLVEATPQAHNVVSQFKLPSGGEGPTWAHPVVCGGTLFIRHGDFLYAYNVQSSP